MDKEWEVHTSSLTPRPTRRRLRFVDSFGMVTMTSNSQILRKTEKSK